MLQKILKPSALHVSVTFDEAALIENLQRKLQ